MRISTLFTVVFILFASSFILRDLFSDEESPRSENAVESEKETAYLQPLSAVGNRDHISSSRDKPAGSDDEETVFAYDTVAVVNRQTGVEREYKPEEIKERREAILAQKSSYAKARQEWRAALNEARKMAIKSGDYTKYEALKAQEPTKSK
jgi:hypothetical protein